MAIFRFFKKGIPVLIRCTECNYEDELSPKEVRLLEKRNAADSVCPVKEPCHICHIGFMIPVTYTDTTGKKYLFHEIKPKIKHLDPDSVMERIFEHPDTENVMFFDPFD